MPQAQANGLTLEYETAGDPRHPPLLLIMGFSCQLVMWPDALVRGLAEAGFHVIRFDNRDIGLTTKLDKLGVPNVMEMFMHAMARQPVSAPYLLDDMAADTVGLLDALGIRDAHVAGASMGGMIAQLVAAKHPARVRSLISIMSTTGNPDLPQAKPEAAAALITPPANLERETLIAHGAKIFDIIGSPGYPAPLEERRAVIARQVDRNYHPAGVARQLAAILASPPRNALLKSVTAPTLVLHGADDPLIPVEAAHDTAKSIPGAKLTIVPGMGHDFTTALSPVLVREIAGFCRGVEAQRKAAE